MSKIPISKANLKFSPEYEKIRNAFNKSSIIVCADYVLDSRSELDNILKSKKMDLSNQHYDWSFSKTEDIYMNVRSSENKNLKADSKLYADLTWNDTILKRFIESRK